MGSFKKNYRHMPRVMYELCVCIYVRMCVYTLWTLFYLFPLCTLVPALPGKYTFLPGKYLRIELVPTLLFPCFNLCLVQVGGGEQWIINR